MRNKLSSKSTQIPPDVLLPKAGSAQSLYCSGVQTVEVPAIERQKIADNLYSKVNNKIKQQLRNLHI